MELDRLITLLEPQPGDTDTHGEPVMTSPIRHRVWARRLDRGGAERIAGEVWIAEAATRWTIRRVVFARPPRPKWRLTADDDTSHEVVHVAEAVMPGRQTRGGMLWLFTVARA